MGITFKSTPNLFGLFHILSLLYIIIFNFLFYLLIKNKKEESLLNILHYLGLFMMLAEVFKQYFCYVYVFNRQLNLWFFPWQICSIAMYLSFLAKYFKGKILEAILIYLTTYSLFTDIIALLLPYDMLRDQIVLTTHSFIYHGLIISEAIIALLILKNKKGLCFKNTLYLFAFTALIAEIINIVSHKILNNIKIEPNMFYITLAYPTTQPILNDIANRYGILFEIFIYLLGISLFSYLLFLVEKYLFTRSHSDKV